MSWLGDIFQGATDFFLPGTGIGKLFEGFTGKQSQDPGFGVDGIFSNPQGAWDKFKNGSTNDVNRAIAEENLNYQRERNEIEDARYEEETAYNRAFSEEERDYSRALQQQIFDREDTALERQASSLSSMGINPLSQNMSGLGAGQAVTASTPPAQSSRGGTALHNDFQMQDMGLLSAITPLMSLFQGVSDLNTGSLSRDSLREQIDYQKLLNQEKDIENAFKKIELEERIKNLQADTANKSQNTEALKSKEKREDEKHPIEVRNLEASTERNERVNNFQEKYGTNDESSIYARILTDIEEQTNRAGIGIENRENSPINKTKNTFTNSMKIVGNALNNTIGKGIRSLYEYLKKPKTKKTKIYDNSFEEAIKQQLISAGW